MIRALVPLMLAASLGGCGAIADIAGGVAAAGSAAASANPAVGYAVGLGVRAATGEAVRWATRRRQDEEQDRIAEAIGAAAPGETRPWRVEHDIPIGNQGGEVRVLRLIPSALAPCKEALFSVVDGEGEAATREWYGTTACEAEGTWRWAAAEPAVPRWGNLH